MARVRARVYISGIVQGVFFRSTMKRQALARDLKGWVRNLSDGRVEAVFEGEEHAVKSMMEWCRRGPTHAVVDNMEVQWEANHGEFERFEVR